MKQVSHIINMYVTEMLLKRLDKACKKLGIPSRSEAIRIAVSEWLEKKGC